MDAPRRCGATFAKLAAPPPATPALPQSWVLTITRPVGGTILGDKIRCGTNGAECSTSFPAGFSVAR